MKTILAPIAGLLLAMPAHAEGGWVADPRNGCKLWSNNLESGAQVRWTGACEGGYASGRGAFEFRDQGQVTARGEADFRAGKREGRGFTIEADGRRIEGEYRDGRLNGRVVETHPDGDRFVGQYRDHLRNGPGVLTSSDGERYEGDYKDGKRDGRGIQVYGGGGRYEGEWADGKPHGGGVYRDASDGKTYRGRWTKGCGNFPDATIALDTDRASCNFE